MDTKSEETENEYSDLTDSDYYDKEKSHFQFEEIDWFQRVHQTTGVLPDKNFMFNQTFGKMNEEVLFKHNYTKEIKLYFKKVILLHNFSTMDMFRKSDLVENTTKAGYNMTVKGNGGTLEVTQKKPVTGYKQDLCFS